MGPALPPTSITDPEAIAASEVRLRQAPLSAISSLAEIIEKPAERFGLELERNGTIEVAHERLIETTGRSCR